MLYLQDPEKTKNIYDKTIIKSKEKTKPMQQILVPRGTKQIYTFSGHSTGATTKDAIYQQCGKSASKFKKMLLTVILFKFFYFRFGFHFKFI